MTGEDLSSDDEAVRRLLAAAAADPVVPPDVVARLDNVLAGLVAEHAAAPAPGPVEETSRASVTDLTDRRRRRWPGLVAAAAAVAVIALGVGTGSGGLDHLMGGGAGSNTTSADAGADTALTESGRDSAGPLSTMSTLPQIRTRSLRVDVQRVADLALARSGSADTSAEPYAKSFPAGPPGCRLPVAGGKDRLVAVRLDGDQATLLLRPAHAGTRRAVLYACDSGLVQSRTTIAARR